MNHPLPVHCVGAVQKRSEGGGEGDVSLWLKIGKHQQAADTCDICLFQSASAHSDSPI